MFGRVLGVGAAPTSRDGRGVADADRGFARGRAAAAPAGAIITQLAQIYNKDSMYASVINVMSVVFCIITMPLMTLLYETIF